MEGVGEREREGRTDRQTETDRTRTRKLYFPRIDKERDRQQAERVRQAAAVVITGKSGTL